MKKYVYLFSILSVGIQPMVSLQGPVSTYAPPFYQNSPASGLTKSQQDHVKNAFRNIGDAFRYNHGVKYSTPVPAGPAPKVNPNPCQSRKDCLKKDLAVLQNFFVDHPTHPANPFLHKLNAAIIRDSANHIFTTQWVIYQKLSKRRQREYREGLRVHPIKSQTVQTSRGVLQANYNQDDVLTRLLEELSHHHNNCQRNLDCLTRDLNIIANLKNRLAYNDPVRNRLDEIYAEVKNLASREIFNTNYYLNLYNPLRSNWSEALRKHKNEKSLGYGRKEWKAIKRSSHPRQWIQPRITNGQPVGQVASAPPQYQGQPQAKAAKPLLQMWNKLGQNLIGGN